MKRKRKEKEKKKKRKEAKKKKVMSEAELGTIDAPSQSFTTRPRGTHRIKRSSLINREFKDIFQKNDCSFGGENPM